MYNIDIPETLIKSIRKIKNYEPIEESAEIAQVSTGEMMELLAERGIKSKITLKDYDEGLTSAVEML